MTTPDLDQRAFDAAYAELRTLVSDEQRRSEAEAK